MVCRGSIGAVQARTDVKLAAYPEINKKGNLEIIIAQPCECGEPEDTITEHFELGKKYRKNFSRIISSAQKAIEQNQGVTIHFRYRAGVDDFTFKCGGTTARVPVNETGILVMYEGPGLTYNAPKIT